MTPMNPMNDAEIVALSKKHTLFEWSAQSKVDPIAVAHAKGIYFYTPEGKRYLYRARVSGEACVRKESRSFLSRVFDGAAAPAVLHLLSQCDVDEFKKLSPEEVRHLRQLLDRDH